MRISLSQIKAGSKCFRYLEYLATYRLPPEDEDIQIIREVITKTYRVTMETQWKVPWKRILGWVDASIFKDVDISKEMAFEEAKKKVERILTFLTKWYAEYLEEQKATYINIPLEHACGHSLIYGEAPLVQVGETPTIILIEKIARNVTGLYNDIEIRGLQWMLAAALEVETVEVKCLQVGPGGSMQTIQTYAGEKEHKRTRDAIRQVASLIELGANYQSVTEMCNSCPFKGRCKL